MNNPNPEYFKRLIHNFGIFRASIQAQIKEVIKNQEITLEDRWNIFCEASRNNLLENYSYVMHLETMKDVSWYDDFYKDRYAHVSWSDMVEQIEDSDDYQSCYKYKNNIAAIKEEILSKGYAGFIYDW